jgi:hypothetical protein
VTVFRGKKAGNITLETITEVEKPIYCSKMFVIQLQFGERQIWLIKIFFLQAAPAQKHLFCFIAFMSLRQAKALFSFAVIRRIVVVVAMAYCAGLLLNWYVRRLENSGKPAGFIAGVVHGAVMPCAMPSLLLGRDVAIYAEKNSGRPYKLGYTVGVNACGAIFFGMSYWRFSRWRRSQPRSLPSP